MKYKLIACDLDFTLLAGEDHNSISPRNKKAIERVVEQGALFVPVTGRNVCMLPEDLKSLDFRYIIDANGGVCHDRVLKRPMFEYALSQRSLKRTMDILKKYEGLALELFIRDHLVIHRSFPFESVMDGHMKALEKESLIVAEDWDDFDYTEPVYKINVPQHLPEATFRELYTLLSEDKEIHVCFNDKRNLEVQAHDANKGVSLERLCGYLGIPLENVIAFGDSGNDIEMITKAGVGVAVGNGDRALKKAADHITAPYDEDGVAVFLEQL